MLVPFLVIGLLATDKYNREHRLNVCMAVRVRKNRARERKSDRAKACKCVYIIVSVNIAEKER